MCGDTIPPFVQLKYLDNSLHFMVPHCKHRGKNDFLLPPKGAVKQYLVPSSFGIESSIKCGGNSDLISLLNSVNVHPVNREYALL